MAFFSLSGTNGTMDRSPIGATKAVSSHIKFAPGPYGNPNGSFFFSGINSSYVELRNTGELDARFSMSVFAWVHLDNSDGPIFNYGCSMWIFKATLGFEVRFVDRKTSKVYRLHKENVVAENTWNFIGTTYDYHTGIATLWVNSDTVMLKSIGSKIELATQTDVRVGASSNREEDFRGRVSCLQFYNQALSVDQIIEAKARCNQSSKYIDYIVDSHDCLINCLVKAYDILMLFNRHFNEGSRVISVVISIFKGNFRTSLHRTFN